VIRFRSREYNLTKEDEVKDLFEKHRPDVVIHASGDVGGIEYNKVHSGRIFFQ